MSGRREPPRWRRYLRFWGEDPSADVEDELAFHMDARVSDLVRSGMADAAAREQAALEFGDVDRIRGELHVIGRHRRQRDRRVRVVADLGADVRLALRALRRNPVFAGSMLATLSIVIGAAGAIFALVNGVLFRPLPYPAAHALVVAWERNLPRERAENVVSVPMYEAWRERSATLAEMAALVPDRQTVIEGGPERVRGAAVTPSWFDVVGVRPVLGRPFTEREARSGDVVVLSHGLWQSRFGGDPTIVGQRVRMTDELFTVVGVMPSEFEPPAFGWLSSEQRYWVPFVPDEDNRNWGRFLLVLGRLAPGATAALADAELKAIVQERARTDASLGEWTADVVPLHAQLTGAVEVPLLVLLGAVLCLLLIGVVNVTNLVLVRAQRRDAEFGVRAALGAGRWRMARQLGAEALAIALLAAPLGVLIATLGVRALAGILPADVPRVSGVRMDAATIALCIGAAAVAVIVLGLVPMLRLSLTRAHDRLRAGNARVVPGPVGRSLVVAEIALAVVLAIGAGLAARSFVALRSVPLGFDAGNVAAFRVALPVESYPSDAARRAFFEALLTQIDVLPGVERTGAVDIRPLGGSGVATTVTPLRGVRAGPAPVADVRVATPNYFATLRIPRLAGSGLADIVPGDVRSVVVSRALARALWPGQNAIGERFVLAMNPPDTVLVAGVVENVRLSGPDAELRPTVYFAHATRPAEAMDVMVRSPLPPETVFAHARSVVRGMDAALPIYETERLAHGVDAASARERLDAALLIAFSVVALMLAATGIYGVLAMEVGARRREIAVRLALGAPPHRVRAEVVRGTLVLTLLGLTLGLGAALALTRFMASFLFGIRPTDAATYTAVAGVLLIVSFMAAWLPARRAAAIDPMHSMRAP